jgi:hypothetical protein
MERWLKAAARYREVAEAELVTIKWNRPNHWDSLEKFMASQNYPAALTLLLATDCEIILADEPESSRRKRRNGPFRAPVANQRVILGSKGFGLKYCVSGSIRAIIYGAPKSELKEPRLLKPKAVLKLCAWFGASEFEVMNKIWNKLDDLTAYAP